MPSPLRCLLQRPAALCALALVVAAWSPPHATGLEPPPHRYYQGWYEVPGQNDTHFTLYAPADPGLYECVIFLHGMGKDDYSFALHQAGLAEMGWIGVAIDYDMVGSTEHRINQVAAAVELLHGWEEVASVSLLGTSWGGKVAFETNARRPELDVSATVLIYPAEPTANPDQVAAIRVDMLDLVGEIDFMSDASERIEELIGQHNPTIDYKLQVYDAAEIPEARHGYFFAPSPGRFSEPAIDTFVRALDFLSWQAGSAGRPAWWDAPKTIYREELLGIEDLGG